MDPLEELITVTQQIKELHASRIRLMGLCREAGYSFTDIADAMGITRQGARRAFLDHFEESITVIPKTKEIKVKRK